MKRVRSTVNNANRLTPRVRWLCKYYENWDHDCAMHELQNFGTDSVLLKKRMAKRFHRMGWGVCHVSNEWGYCE